MPPIGNPQDILTTPYGYAGQMAPETAVAEQQLNRRRLIANMLMQNGMQKPQGRMAGRFFVGANPLEHVANLAQTGLGAYLTNDIDSKSKDLMTQDRQSVVDAIKGYQDSKKPQQYQSPQESSGMPTLPPQAPSPDQGQALPPRPDGPYNGEVGAAAMPEAGVQSAQPPMTAQPPSSIAGQDSIQGMDMGKAAPADMGQMVPPPQATPEQPLPSPAPAPSSTAPGPARFVEPPAKKTTMDDLAQLMTHQHPQVRAYGQMLAQQMQQEKAREDQQNFLSQEKGLDRDVRREGVLENSRMREAQMQNTMALTQMQIDARMQQGQDANELKASLAKQANDLQKLQIQTSAELKKADIGSRTELAKQHDETLKAIAQTKQQARGALPVSALKEQKEALEAIGTASAMKSDMASIRSQIDGGKLNLGLMTNLGSEAKNKAGMSDENSRNYASFKATLEKMRNDSLRLNKGVQTEGDSVRAWNELIANINDKDLVKQRLSEIEKINDRAVNLQRLGIDTIRQNFNAGPMDTGDYENQPAAVGANKATGGQRAVNRTGMHNGKKVVEYSDGSIEYAP